jgi:hypothetical protein
MMVLVPPGGRAEEAWTWLCRALAVVGFGFLLATTGFQAPMGAYLLLLGLFFGPEVIRGQLSINRQSRNDDEPK